MKKVNWNIRKYNFLFNTTSIINNSWSHYKLKANDYNLHILLHFIDSKVTPVAISILHYILITPTYIKLCNFAILIRDEHCWIDMCDIGRFYGHRICDQKSDTTSLTLTSNLLINMLLAMEENGKLIPANQYNVLNHRP